MIVSDALREKMKAIPQYVIRVGVFNETTKRVDEVSVGLTNAELMFIHENGSPLQHIPARPVLHMTIEYGKTLLNKTLNKALKAYFDDGLDALELELEKFCVKLEKYAQKIIYSNDGRLAPNAPSVAAKKKGNHPLFDTGQLARSITCRLVQVK